MVKGAVVAVVVLVGAGLIWALVDPIGSDHPTTVHPTTLITSTTRSPTAEIQYQVGEWGDDYAWFIPELTALDETILADADHDLDQLPVDCARLVALADEALGAPPIPSAAANDHWQTALRAQRDAGQACVDDPTVIGVRRMGDLIVTAGDELRLAAAELRR